VSEKVKEPKLSKSEKQARRRSQKPFAKVVSRAVDLLMTTKEETNESERIEDKQGEEM
jgi:hypothetical protein